MRGAPGCFSVVIWHTVPIDGSGFPEDRHVSSVPTFRALASKDKEGLLKHMLMVVLPRSVLGLVFLMAAIDDYHYLFKGGMLFKAPLSPAGAAWLKNLKEGASFYLPVKATVDLVGGALLVSGFYSHIGLLLLLPVIVMVILFQFTINRGGVPIAIVLLFTSGTLLVAYAGRYLPLFQP
jgi:hypothetical protein